MSPRDLLEALGTIGDASEGVDRLRGLIMKLAILGSLLPDGCSRDDWTESTIGDTTVTMQPGFACSKKHQVSGGHVHLRTHNINTLGQFNTDQLVEIDPDKVDPNKSFLRKGDVLFNNTNSRELVGKSCVIPSDLPYGFSNHMTLLRPIDDLDSGFLWVILRALWRTGFFEQTCKAWIGQAGVNTRQLAKIEIEYPPLAEQRRIVAKVDELMALLDEFERARDERDARRAAFRDSALAALQNAEDAEAVHAAWSRITANLADCFADPADIAPLRQTILQLAVRGLLVPQDPGDEPASRSIQRAADEFKGLPPVRGRKAATTVQYGDAGLFVCRPPDIVSSNGWEVVELAKVARLESGHTPDRNIKEYWGGRYPWIGIKDARKHRGGEIVETGDTVTEAGVANSATRPLPTGTVCLSRTASVGYTVLMGREMCTSQDFVNFVCSSALLPRYLQTIFEAEYSALKRFAKGAVHSTIYFPEVKAFHILLPPVAEQERILTKVDELMAVCDELEQRLTEAKAHQSAFAAAAVHHLDLVAPSNAPTEEAVGCSA